MGKLSCFTEPSRVFLVKRCHPFPPCALFVPCVFGGPLNINCLGKKKALLTLTVAAVPLAPLATQVHGSKPLPEPKQPIMLTRHLSANKSPKHVNSGIPQAKDLHYVPFRSVSSKSENIEKVDLLGHDPHGNHISLGHGRLKGTPNSPDPKASPRSQDEAHEQPEEEPCVEHDRKDRLLSCSLFSEAQAKDRRHEFLLGLTERQFFACASLKAGPKCHAIHLLQSIRASAERLNVQAGFAIIKESALTVPDRQTGKQRELCCQPRNDHHLPHL